MEARVGDKWVVWGDGGVERGTEVAGIFRDLCTLKVANWWENIASPSPRIQHCNNIFTGEAISCTGSNLGSLSEAS